MNRDFVHQKQSHRYDNGHVHYIGIGEYKITGKPEDILKTCGLGSCVAVIMYDTKKLIGSLIHIALPDSKVDISKAARMPGYYVDTGLPMIIELMKKQGATKPDVWIKIAGGANTLNSKSEFDIGKRNILAIKRYLWKYAMGPINEDIGGTTYRTVSFYVDTGRIVISSGNYIREL
ncbi:MAG: chemotaxis protein CheD [Spirochaetales bacterium]|nr:chemotaxis protein CheD [Spirochaetales bacterium]